MLGVMMKSRSWCARKGGLAKMCEMRMQRTGDVVGSRLDCDVGLVVGV